MLRDDWAVIQQALDVNIRASLVCMREAVADMREKPDAAIICISSMTGHRVMPGTPAVYAATKHALRVLTDGVRAELVQEGRNVKVALISPGLVDTPWHHRPDGVLTQKGAYPYPPLVPAALENQITAENAPRLKTKIIIEGANGPLTSDASEMLDKAGVLIVPDHYANAGGVVVSYFEWLQGLQYHFWRENEITTRLQEVMTHAVDQVCALAEKNDVDLRTAALMVGVRRVADGYRTRGLYP